MSSDHKLEVVNLPSGSKLLVVNVPGQRIAVFAYGVKAGYYYVDTEKYELPHLLEHLAFLGNKTYPDKTIFLNELDKIGAYANAETRPTSIRYGYITTLKELPKVVEIGLSQLTGPLIRQQDILSEKMVVRRELQRNLDNPGNECSFKLLKAVLPRRISKLERIETLKNINRQDIVEYYEKYYTAKNTYFILAGDFKKSNIKELTGIINKGLKNYPKGREIATRFPKLGDYNAKIFLTDKEVKEIYFDISFINPKYDESLFPVIKVAHALYNGTLSSRLFNAIRTAGLNYQVYTGYDIAEAYSEFYIADNTDPENFIGLLDACFTELQVIINGEYSDDELEVAKGHVRGSMEMSYNLPSDYVRWYAEDFITDRPFESIDSYIEKVESVTKKDITKAAKHFFKPDSWVISALGPDVTKTRGELANLFNKHFH
jgi:zinc protease